MAERGKFWSVAETKLLLDTWSQDHIQKQLRAAVRNDAVFGKIAEVLAKREYYRTIQQCRAKIKALKKRYREIVDKLRKSGTGRESDEDDDFPFFSDLHAVMGGRATVSPIHLLDSSSSTQSQGGQQDDDNDVDRPESPISPTSRLDTPGSLADRADPELSGLLSSLDTGAPSTSRPNTPATFTGQRNTPATSTSRPNTPATSTTRRPSTPASRPDNPGFSITATEESEPSSKPDADTAGSSTSRRAYEPKKKKRKVTKLQKAEEAADSVVAKVLADQAKRREESAEIERKRLEIAQQIAEREAERDRQFMSSMQQMMALMVQSLGAQGYPSPTPFPMGYQPGSVFPVGSQPGPVFPMDNQPGSGFPVDNQPGSGFPMSNQPVSSLHDSSDESDK